MTEHRTFMVRAVVRLDVAWTAMTDDQKQEKKHEVDQLLDHKLRESGLPESTVLTRKYDDSYAAPVIGAGEDHPVTPRPQPDYLFLAGWAFGVRG